MDFDSRFLACFIKALALSLQGNLNIYFIVRLTFVSPMHWFLFCL